MPDEQPDRQAPTRTPQPLPVERLYRSADLGALDFETTADLAPLPGLSDQPRAYAAINFGTGINQRGFNIIRDRRKWSTDAAVGQNAAGSGSAVATGAS